MSQPYTILTSYRSHAVGQQFTITIPGHPMTCLDGYTGEAEVCLQPIRNPAPEGGGWSPKGLSLRTGLDATEFVLL